MGSESCSFQLFGQLDSNRDKADDHWIWRYVRSSSGPRIIWKSLFFGYSAHQINTWLAVWNIFLFFHTLGISSSQLTHIFQRGWNHQPAINTAVQCQIAGEWRLPSTPGMPNLAKAKASRGGQYQTERALAGMLNFSILWCWVETKETNLDG
jgi:hypothetical protein